VWDAARKNGAVTGFFALARSRHLNHPLRKKQGTGAGDPRLDGGAGAPSIYYFFYIPHEENVMTIMTNRNPLPHKPSGVIVTLMTS
jgi:hypothetical protein